MKLLPVLSFNTPMSIAQVHVTLDENVTASEQVFEDLLKLSHGLGRVYVVVLVDGILMTIHPAGEAAAYLKIYGEKMKENQTPPPSLIPYGRDED